MRQFPPPADHFRQREYATECDNSLTAASASTTRYRLQARVASSRCQNQPLWRRSHTLDKVLGPLRPLGSLSPAGGSTRRHRPCAIGTAQQPLDRYATPPLARLGAARAAAAEAGRGRARDALRRGCVHSRA